MEKRKLFIITCVVLGFILGALGGAYIGLIIGGSFLGSFDIYKFSGIEGYELTTYMGMIVGSLISIPFSIKYAIKKKY